MDERRLYAILAIGGLVLVGIALVDVTTGGGGDGDTGPTSTSGPLSTTTATSSTDTSATTSPSQVAQDEVTQADVRTGLLAMKVVYADTERYSADPADLQPVEPALRFARGIATQSAALDVVFVETDGAGQVACVSARAPSGELFMVKDVRQGAAPGIWYARGAVLPTQCDDQPLATAW